MSQENRHPVIYDGGRAMDKTFKFFSKAITVLLAIVMLLGTSLTSFAYNELNLYTFSGGEGTKKRPYLISNKEDLFQLSEMFSADGGNREAYFKLTNDIDLGDTVWTPIGSPTIGFSGVFDGNGKRITIRNMADGNYLGLFSQVDNRGTIENLIVKGIISKKVSSKETVNFGLLAGRAEGTIENCIAEGNIALTIESTEDISVGGLIGFGVGSISNLKNEASINLTGIGKKHITLGGVIGSSRGNISPISNTTNTGTIVGNIDGQIFAGGVIGTSGFGSSVYNALNQGNISVSVKNIPNNRAATGGIVGEIREANINRALNKGRVSISYSGNYNREEIFASGIAGLGEVATITNAGNEAYVEAKDSKILFATGIVGGPGRDFRMANVYNKGNIYGISSYRDGELYVLGLTGDVTTVDNFYNSGTVRLKAGNRGEVDGEAITNVRPGESPKSYSYGYWPTGVLAFPLLQKEPPTTSPFNIGTGKLNRNVNIGGKSYNTITEALNAWVDTQKGDYLKWVGQNTPTFDWSFGYKIPEIIAYKNGKEGKWINASDWAYGWLDKADKLDIIPDILLEEDMTEGITRMEFSALIVRLYEYLSGEEVIVKYNSPFKDTDDISVIKAYELGIVTGTGNGLFSPKAILTREQASTMLARVYQRVFDKSLNIEGVSKFSDHDLISSWAKEPVYFMAKNDILKGIGNNIFAPSHKQGEKESYGRATREQAFKIAVAMIEKFK